MYLIYTCVCAGMVLLTIVLQKLAFNYTSSLPEDAKKIGYGTIETAIFALMGLLVALTFAGAQARLELRKHVIVQEINAINKAFLRLDLLPEKKVRNQMQLKFLSYLDSRIQFYKKMVDADEGSDELTRTDQLQNDIWKSILANTGSLEGHATRLLLVPALNDMFDIVTTRTAAIHTHTSGWIFSMLLFTVAVCAVLCGISMSKTGHFSWTYATLFALITMATIYMIFDMEYPRFGFINLDYMEGMLVEVKQTMVQYMDSSRT